MALLAMLKQTDGVLRRWWDEQLPDIGKLTAAGRWQTPLAVPLSPEAKPYAGLIGTAFDYRARWLWPAGVTQDLIGVACAALTLGPKRSAVLADEVAATLGELAGRDSMSSAETDECLTRLALVLARLETVYRCGIPVDPASGVHRRATLDEMIDTQPEAAVAEIRAITKASLSVLKPLLEAPVILNPTFEHSSLVGGADGDLIIDGCLVDFKTSNITSLPTMDLRQIVSYALLDSIDQHSIRRVGVLFARRPQLITWNLDELLEQAGGTNRTDLTASMVNTLRGQA